MERNPNPPVQVLSPLKFMETFYTNYPPEKAQSLLWRWFILSIKDEFSKLPPKEMQVFEDFFESLDILVMAVAIAQQESTIGFNQRS